VSEDKIEKSTKPGANTVNDLYRSLVIVLSKIGATSPVGDAKMIIEHITGLSTLTDIHTSKDEVTEEQIVKVNNILREKRRGRPIQYTIGWTNFFGRRFSISKGVFIPRFETEVLVRRAIKLLGEDSGKRVFEVGCGCGAVAITLAIETGASCYGVDIDGIAIKVAEKNIRNYNVGDKVRVWMGDLYEGIKEGDTFDLIVANPPYIKQKDIEKLPKEVKDHEPISALYGGEDGFDIIRYIVAGARDYLKPGGRLLLEFGEEIPEDFNTYAELCGLKLVDVIKDLSDKPRVLELSLL